MRILTYTHITGVHTIFTDWENLFAPNAKTSLQITKRMQKRAVREQSNKINAILRRYMPKNVVFQKFALMAFAERLPAMH